MRLSVYSKLESGRPRGKRRREGREYYNRKYNLISNVLQHISLRLDIRTRMYVGAFCHCVCLCVCVRNTIGRIWRSHDTNSPLLRQPTASAKLVWITCECVWDVNKRKLEESIRYSGISNITFFKQCTSWIIYLNFLKLTNPNHPEENWKCISTDPNCRIGVYVGLSKQHTLLLSPLTILLCPLLFAKQQCPDIFYLFHP